MMLIPTKFQHNLTAQMAEINYFKTDNQNTPLNGNKFANIIKAALETKKEMQAKRAESSLNITEEMAIAMIPQSLYIYLSIVMDLKDYRKDEFKDSDKEDCSDDNSETDSDDDSEPDSDDKEGDLESDDEHQNENKFTKGLFTKVLSIAQDIVYVASKGRKMTPKHLGLALSLHQETRKKELVTLLNKAGNCMSYKQVLQVDNTLAELTLSTLDNETGAVIPPNIREKSDSNSILQMTADNIDILTKTLDGKNTFHATQMVVFQRSGKTTDDVLQSTFRKKRTSRLHIPTIINALPDPITDIESTPDFKNPVDITWFNEIPGNCKINEKDLSFLFSRQKQPDGNRVGWTKFNKDISTNNSPLTASGFMPLILHPAHEYNTLTLVLNRCISVADKLKYQHVVLTVDQALHWRLKDIIWTSEIFKERIILKMGGLHLSNNYIKAIGQHMIKTGLAEIWLESGILAEGSIAKVLNGTDYAKAMRAHKLTYQALWRILIPKFMEYLKTNDKQKQAESLQALSNGDADGYLTFFEEEENQKSVDEFLRTISKDNVTTAFWVQYIEYVSVLLDFTRSIRDARWKLYIPSLIRMLPLIARYDHLNYLKSLIIYIADLHNLPIDVEEAFESGDFVVKRTENKFNQVDADHAQEWLVGTSKDSGGITGIQNKDATLQRWALSFHWRTVITQKTFSMLGVSSLGSKHNEEFPGRIKRDNHDEDELLKVFLDMKIFSDDNCSKPLHNLVTKDVATLPIQTALLGAFKEGLMHVHNFVKDRLIRQEDGNVKVNFNATVSRTNPITMATMEKKTNPATTEKKIIKSDAKFLQRIIVSYEAGRPIDLPSIFKHELHPIPLGLFELDGSLRSGDQLSLMNLFLKNVHCPTVLRTSKESCHYIYNAEVVIAKLGKPKSINTFGEYAAKCISFIKEHSTLSSRLDILFDRYLNLTAKISKIQKSTMTPIRRIIESGNVPLPKSWNNFFGSNDNRADLAKFLSNELSSHQFDDIIVVTSGGFELVYTVSSSSNAIEAKSLSSNHSEVDIRAVLHAIESEASTIVVNAHGSEILALLIHFFYRFNCDELWLATGTIRKYVPIHTISATIPNVLKKNILAFHAVTGSTYTSQLIHVTKARAWKIFQKFSDLLDGFGDEILSEDVMKAVEEFLLKCYNGELEQKTFDDARVWLFKKLKNVTDLPPTSDAIKLHIKRCHWTTYTWKNACNKIVPFKDPIDYGWELGEDNVYLPTLTSTDIYPRETFEFVKCGCKAQCSTMKCSCRRNKPSLKCTSLCKCFAECSNSNTNGN